MERRLWRAMGQLERLEPAFFSMTYGALGSAQQVSVDTAISMHQESPVPVAAHLTCAGASAADVMGVVRVFHDAGIRRIVALRGDCRDDDSQSTDDSFASAAELVEAISNDFDFDISVAAYPEVHPRAASAAADLRHLKRKLDAGAQRAITQYFFDTDCFLRFRDRAAAIGISQPIVPGILPIRDYQKVAELSARCGASVPAGLEARYARASTPEAVYQLSLELALAQCEALIAEGVDHLHLYTLNQTDMCFDISLALGAAPRHLAVSSAA